ncbi:MAG: quinone-dependent dihydroorotate dehydrogenase [Prevotellaceae bacterium]|nr:quinone-dependent dihydroorotate dehydrogenase [Prevotellaceae bacterium]
MYTHLRKVIFRIGPETSHLLTIKLLKCLRYIPFAKGILRLSFSIHDKSLEREVLGIKFKNPVGLAAGFDKNAEIVGELDCLGFGFVEIGSVTPLPQPGNPKPRVFRLPADKALVNRMGINNVGAKAVIKNLHRCRTKKQIIVGGNLSKNATTFNVHAPADYERCFALLYNEVDYFVVNVSCPNVTSLTQLQDRDILTQIIDRIINVRHYRDEYKPILLKISPDLNTAQLDDILDLVREKGIDGIVAVNTSVTREALHTPAEKVETIGKGGLSGAPLTAKAIERVRYIYAKTQGQVPIIGVGGVMTPDDAVNMLAAGASLIQVYTGFVYNGPGFVKKILKRLKQEVLWTQPSLP